jgi:hypothetical protein
MTILNDARPSTQFHIGSTFAYDSEVYPGGPDMGVSREVRHNPAVAADWQAIRDRLSGTGESPVLRMIDNLPAFPDETPEPMWRELRLGLAGGMVTLRRELGVLTCVVWGNADPALLRARDQLCWACAAATGGTIQLDDGSSLSADAFAALLDRRSHAR